MGRIIMQTETTKLTVRLPKQDVDFVKAYAKAHGLSVTEVIDRYLRRIRALEEYSPSVELDEITGLIPQEVNAEDIYHQHLMEKHSR